MARVWRPVPETAQSAYGMLLQEASCRYSMGPVTPHRLAVSPDGRWIATGGAGNDLRIWEANTGKNVSTLAGHEAPVTAIAFTSDSQQLTSGDDRGRILIWQKDPQTEGWLKSHQLQGHSRSIVELGIYPRGPFARFRQR